MNQKTENTVTAQTGREAFDLDQLALDAMLACWQIAKNDGELPIAQVRASMQVQIHKAIQAALSARAQGEAYVPTDHQGRPLTFWGGLATPAARAQGGREVGEAVGWVSRSAATAHMRVNLPEGTPLYTAAPKQQAMEVGEPGAVDALVSAANATLAANPHDDTMWTLEAAVAPFNATKPAECENGCPPQQVCDYCQIAARYTAAPKQQAVGVAEAWAIIEEMCVITEAVTPDPTDVRATLNRLIDYHVSVNNDLEQQAVDKETLVAFERVFWKAVELSGSRDFDHDVCKEVRDFRSLHAALTQPEAE